jgi:formylglycine-generating enzyme required for sulfatase activity
MKKEHHNVEKNKQRISKSFMAKPYAVIADRVISGGSFYGNKKVARVTRRYELEPLESGLNVGFRLVLEVKKK